MGMTEGESQKIVKTDVLKVQVFDMPVIDTSRRFCYRFVEPIPMIWQTDGRITFMLATSLQMNPHDVMGEFLLNKYREVIENSKNQGMWHESLKWLEDVHSVEVVECNIVPTGGFTFTSNTASILPPSIENMQAEIEQKVEGR